MMNTATAEPPAPTRQTSVCRLCHLEIVPSNQYYRTKRGTIRIGHCICHEYVREENHSMRWIIIEGTMPVKKRGRSEARIRFATIHGDQNTMNDSLIYCIGCHALMVYHKEYDKTSGYIGIFRCPQCFREQHHE